MQALLLLLFKIKIKIKLLIYAGIYRSLVTYILVYRPWFS